MIYRISFTIAGEVLIAGNSAEHALDQARGMSKASLIDWSCPDPTIDLGDPEPPCDQQQQIESLAEALGHRCGLSATLQAIALTEEGEA